MGSKIPDMPADAKKLMPPYVPPPAILKLVLREEEGSPGPARVVISRQAFNRIIELLLSPTFDEKGYLRRHPDIKYLVATRKLQSGHAHFMSSGFLEGRDSPAYEVDEKWYLKTYPDVKKAIEDGGVESATMHFRLYGYFDGRSPSPHYLSEVQKWQEIARQNSL